VCVRLLGQVAVHVLHGRLEGIQEVPHALQIAPVDQDVPGVHTNPGTEPPGFVRPLAVTLPTEAPRATEGLLWQRPSTPRAPAPCWWVLRYFRHVTILPYVSPQQRPAHRPTPAGPWAACVPG
jgi:hypothetical protein